MTKVCTTIALCLATAASGQLTEHIKLLPNDGDMRDEFGVSVSIFGNISIVGAWRDDLASTNEGSAYVFDTTTGQQLFKLTAGDAAADDFFGCSVAISQTTAIVGARLDDHAGTNEGSAYVFDTTTGQQLFKITASDATSGDQFGFSVATSGTIAIVGAWWDGHAGLGTGSAYIFDTTTGQQLFKLTASDAAELNMFGYSVAISGSTAIVGAIGNDIVGSAYIFDVTTGQQLFKLTASDATWDDLFGSSVAISGSTAIVGASWDDDLGNASGSAYVFDATKGQQLFKLTASDGEARDEFGSSVSVSGTTAIIGVSGDDGGGSAYLFDTSTGQQLFKLAASDAAEGDNFGISVAIDGSTALVGAYRDDNAGENSGLAYVFDLSNLCPGDIADDFGTLGGDGMVSFGDFLALLGLVGPCPGGTPGCDGDIADDFGILDADGMVSFGDFLALLGLVGPCP